LERTKGTKITAGQMKELHKDGAPIKIFAGGKTIVFVNFDDIPEKNINREPSIIVKSRGIIEFEYYDKPFSHKNEMWAYHSNNYAIHIKYIYYFMRVNESYFQKIASKMQMPQIATPDTDKFKVPIPCPDNPERSLAIQSEIVRILDAFTALTNELTNELKLRKQQYNYYREQLLSFDDGSTKFAYLEKLLDGAEVEWKVLGDVAKKIYSGGTPDTKKTEYWEGGTFPWMSSGEVNLKTVKETEKYITEAGLNNSSAKLVPKNSVVMALAGQGKTRGKVARTRIALTTNQSLAALTFDEKKINSDYIFYFLETQYESLRQISSGNSGRGGLNLQMISAYKVPVPCPNNPEKSLAIQSEIVRILDKFDTLTNSISEGLPREIELRKKQYEHYRNLLFSFPKPVADN
ncbi:TPA: restriction endonuclease subunit S, partial [Salmonella enterica subsp. enterica serovar Newport]|nr:restriction endonuclease subunit S [Salmonella enterica subsp. enterica serovar Newport]